MRFAFFGTAPLAQSVLSELEKNTLIPALVIAGPDTPGRRGKGIVSPIEKLWALERNIPVLQPQKIDALFLSQLREYNCDLFIIASYGKILPQALLNIPPLGCINLHPSLLPRLRGPSPIRSAILLDEKEVGVSIMKLDEEMDHGPLLAQKKVHLPYRPMRGRELDVLLAKQGAQLLAQIVPQYVSGTITPQEQQHDVATYCGFFKKEDGHINVATDAYQNLLKIRAFDGWPATFTYFKVGGKDVRVKIIDAHIDNEKLVLDTVLPEGGVAISFADFLTLID